jgi:D-alanyl-D-alanine carboxypeptidase
VLHDPDNDVTLVVWANLTVWPDDRPTALTLMLKVLDQAYRLSPLHPEPPTGL